MDGGYGSGRWGKIPRYFNVGQFRVPCGTPRHVRLIDSWLGGGEVGGKCTAVVTRKNLPRVSTTVGAVGEWCEYQAIVWK